MDAALAAIDTTGDAAEGLMALGAASGKGGTEMAGLRLALARGIAGNECAGARDEAPLRSQFIESIARSSTNRDQASRFKNA